MILGAPYAAVHTVAITLVESVLIGAVQSVLGKTECESKGYDGEESDIVIVVRSKSSGLVVKMTEMRIQLELKLAIEKLEKEEASFGLHARMLTTFRECHDQIITLNALYKRCTVRIADLELQQKVHQRNIFANNCFQLVNECRVLIATETMKADNYLCQCIAFRAFRDSNTNIEAVVAEKEKNVRLAQIAVQNARCTLELFRASSVLFTSVRH